LPKLKQQIDQLLTDRQPDSHAAKLATVAEASAEIEQSIAHGQQRDKGHSR
jgi:hypothetical protein